jgi:hypothetical protein
MTKLSELISDKFTEREKQSILLPSQYYNENDDNTKDKLKDTF